MLGAHKSHPELSPIADQSALLLLLPEIRELKLNYWLTLSCSQLNARACPITITHKAILASAQQGTEGTCQHIPPESFFLYPWLTHDKSWKELPPQHSLEHVCTRRGKGFSAEGSKGVCMKGDGRRRAKRSRNEKTGHRLHQPAGHRFKRDQHCYQPWDSDVSGGHRCILFPHSDPSALPRWTLPGPYSTSKACLPLCPPMAHSQGLSQHVGARQTDSFLQARSSFTCKRPPSTAVEGEGGQG